MIHQNSPLAQKILLISMILCCSGSWAVAQKTWVVCPDCPTPQIRQAITLAAPGDRIEIQTGDYHETNLVIDKPLHLQGIGQPVLHGETGNEIMIIASDSVWIEGLRFQSVPRSHLKDLAALRVQRKQHFIIRDNTFDDTFFAIYLEHAKYGEIENNRITGRAVTENSSGNGIHAWYSENLCIANNLVAHHRDGIYLEFVNNSDITGNYSTGNIRYGLHFMFSNDNQYEHNTFRDNGAGVAVMFSKRINMRSNLFDHNWGRSSYGLLLKEIYDAEITDNLFSNNTIAIHLEGAGRISYQHNTLERNGWAVRISGGCVENRFSDNNFLHNTMDVVLNGRMNDNSLAGNYWSEYTGYDLDHDGRGDIPFRPVKLFSYVITQAPESILLLRSLFIDLLNFSEKVNPAFTPADLTDPSPLMQAL